MKKSDALPSRFFKAADIEEEDITLTIRNLTMEKMNDGKEKPVAWFKERAWKDKGLVINSTNWDIIAGMHGEDSDDWTGKSITLTTEMVNNPQGQRVPSVRVIEIHQPKTKGTKTNPAPTRGTAEPAAVTADNDNDNEEDPPF